MKHMGQRSDLDIGEPGLHGPEALHHGDVVHHNHAVCFAKELLGYAAVPASVQIQTSAAEVALALLLVHCVFFQLQ